jgi:hypothetical protein
MLVESMVFFVYPAAWIASENSPYAQQNSRLVQILEQVSDGAVTLAAT